MFNLKGKSAVITGGGSGIGRAIALCLAQQGVRVSILDKNSAAADEILESIQKKGGEAEFFDCDVSNQNQVWAVINGRAESRSRIDILINSAGIAFVGTLENTTEEDMDRLYAVNVKGTYNTMYAAIPIMKRQGNGVILNMASVAASTGIAERFAYSMTKGAVVSMTLSVARDYIDYGIRCNCISPARVHTPFVDGFLKANYPGQEQEVFEKLAKTQPIGRMGKPEEVASLAVYLCSDEAAFLTGCDYPLDGGFLHIKR